MGQKLLATSVLLIIIFFLPACGSLEEQMEIAKGEPLENLNLTYDLAKLKKFHDPNFYYPAESDYELLLYNVDPNFSPEGSVTALCLQCSNLDIPPLPLLYFQAFRKNTTQKQLFLEIYYRFFTREDIEPYIVYEDEEIAVVDVTDFLPVPDFAEQLELCLQGKYKYDRNWFTEVYKYVKTYKDLKVKKIKDSFQKA